MLARVNDRMRGA